MEAPGWLGDYSDGHTLREDSISTPLKHPPWYDQNSGNETHPVGTLKPSAWGLYDMHGNVWEWVEDWYAEDYYRSSPNRDPQGPSAGAYRVFRGGSWNGSALYTRSALRYAAHPGDRTVILGFRCLSSAGVPGSGGR